MPPSTETSHWGLVIALAKDLYAKVASIQDYETCLAVWKELSELLGLHPARQEMWHCGQLSRRLKYVAICCRYWGTRDHRI